MSPLELSLRNSSKKTKGFWMRRIKILNIGALLLLSFIFFYYAFIANGLVGVDYRTKNLYKKLDALREEVRALESEANNLRLPALIKDEVGKKMVKEQQVTYLKPGREELVVIINR